MMKKCFLFLLLSVLISITAKAQTFFEVKYYDKVDKCRYLGLMTYWDNEQCYLRCVDINKPDDSWDCAYQCDFQKQGRTNFMIFSPVPERGKENLSYPYFVWTWTKKDASDQSESPYVVFDLSEVGRNMQTAEYFTELELSKMNKEYVKKFYDEDEEMFGVITEACNTVNNQEAGEDNGGGTSTVSEKTSPANDKPVTMHFIMVAATKDKSIGESVVTDLKLAEPEFKNFAKLLKINYQEHIISDNDFSKKNIMNAINSVNPSSNDIVVFFYSGHGFRFDDDKDDYPNMFLTYSDEGITSNKDYLGVSEVYNMLTKKKARLTIVLTDCCNSYYGATRKEIETSGLHARGRNSYDLKKLRKLFINSSGSLKVTAAKAGQFALCNTQGGYLLTSFLTNIHSAVSAVSDEEPSWQKIVDNARENVKRKTKDDDYNKGSQIVVRSISIKETQSSNDTGEAEIVSADSPLDNDDNDSGNSSDDSDLSFTELLLGGACVLIPLWILIKLLKKIFGKKKQN